MRRVHLISITVELLIDQDAVALETDTRCNKILTAKQYAEVKTAVHEALDKMDDELEPKATT